MEVAEEKSLLRRAVLCRLQAMAPRQRERLSAQLRARLAVVFSRMEAERQRPLGIALYAPLPHEVDLMPLLQEQPQHRYAFPRCLPGRQMNFHTVKAPAQELVEGKHGILAPLPHLPLMPPDATDLIIVPGVAFTESGLRVGYGGGYYDRYLPRCPQAVVLAVAFEEQMVVHIPTEAHDIRLPQVIHTSSTACHP